MQYFKRLYAFLNIEKKLILTKVIVNLVQIPYILRQRAHSFYHIFTFYGWIETINLSY